MKRKVIIALILCLGMFFAFSQSVNAQEDGFRIHLRRDFGFGFGSQIRGTFTVSLVGDEQAVQEVTFLIDDQVMTTVKEAPFKYRFNTDDYGYGIHAIWANVILVDGSVVETPILKYDFINPSEEGKHIRNTLLGIGGVIIVSLLIVGAVQTFLMKGNKKHTHQAGEPRSYGMLGGTICPKCGRPFPRHIWGMNLVVGRLDRCENCGKWVMTVRATPAALKAAEEEEREEALAEKELPEVREEHKDLLEESKFIDDL